MATSIAADVARQDGALGHCCVRADAEVWQHTLLDAFAVQMTCGTMFDGWIERYRLLWDARFDELDKIVDELQQEEKTRARRKRKVSPRP